MSKQVLAGWVLSWTGIIGGAAGLVGALVVWRILASNDVDIWAVLVSTIGLCTLSVALLLMATFALENMVVNSNQTRICTTILQLTLRAFCPDHPYLRPVLLPDIWLRDVRHPDGHGLSLVVPAMIGIVPKVAPAHRGGIAI